MSGFPIKINDQLAGLVVARRHKRISVAFLDGATSQYYFDASNWKSIVFELGTGASSLNSFQILGSNDGRKWKNVQLDSMDLNPVYASNIIMNDPSGSMLYTNVVYRFYCVQTHVSPNTPIFNTITLFDDVIEKSEIGINRETDNNIRISASGTTASDITIQSGGAPYKRVICSVFELFNNGTEAISFTLCGTYPVDPSACTPLLKGTVQPGGSYKWDKIELPFPSGGQGARLAFDAHTGQNLKYNFFGYFSR